MIVQYFMLYLIASFGWTKVSSFVFEDEGRHYRAQVSKDSSSISSRTRTLSNFGPTSIEHIFNIPTSVIQSTSTAAQSFYPENADTINKVFDIPVQTLQAIGNFVKDVVPDNSQSLANQRDEKFQKIREQQQQQLQLQTVQAGQQQDEGHTTHRRHIVGGFGLISTFGDLLFGGHGHSAHGNRGSTFGSDIYYFGDQGNHQGHKKHKKKNKHGHFGGHGYGNNIGSKPTFDNDKSIYHLYDIHDLLPNGLFSWNPTRTAHKIQNKIAPGFDDYS